MNNINSLFTIHIFFILGALSGCSFIEGNYELISDKDLKEAEIEVPFPSRWDSFKYNNERNFFTSNDVLREEGYIIEYKYGEIIEVKKNDIVFQFSTKLKSTHLSDKYVIFTDGNTGIEDGFIRYLFRPKYSRLNTFNRETFELIDQRVVLGVLRNVIIIDEYVYFHVANYRDEGFYGRFKLSN